MLCEYCYQLTRILWFPAKKSNGYCSFDVLVAIDGRSNTGNDLKKEICADKQIAMYKSAWTYSHITFQIFVYFIS